MPDELKAELKSVVDVSIKENLETIVGPRVAEAVEKKVDELRFERFATGTDKSGLTPDQKVKFMEDVKVKAPYVSSSDQAGGYLVPTEVHAGIIRIAETTGLVVRDSRRWPMSSDELEIPRYTGSVMQGEYIGQDEEADETQNDFGVARLNVKQWINIFRMSNALLQDANVDVADWLMSMAAEGFAYRLDREGFVGGTFAASPFIGLLQSGDVTVQTLGSGLTGFEDLTPAEAAKAIGSVASAALPGSAFYFSPSTWAQIRSQKSGDIYVFNQDNTAMASFNKENGISPVGMIWGYPVYTTDVLPAYSASAISTKFGVFGNLKLAVAWGDRGPMEIAKSNDATVGSKSLFRTNQTALRFTHRHAISLALPAAAVVFKTAAA
jgi:HK97 family phage major capsid protein